MSWNYRAIDRSRELSEEARKAGEELIAIHEVYYNDEGRAVAYSENPVTVIGDDLHWLVAKLQEAIIKPTLSLEDFNQ